MSVVLVREESVAIDLVREIVWLGPTKNVSLAQGQYEMLAG